MKYPSKTIIFSLIVIVSCLTLVFFSGQYKLPQEAGYIIVNVDSNKLLFETDRKFLSNALDMSFLKCSFHNMNSSAWNRLEEITNYLSPGFLRLGGTAADQVVFKVLNSENEEVQSLKNCSLEIQKNEVLYITDKDWIKINQFVKKTNLNFIFDLNVLLRSSAGWNTSNAQMLLKVSEENGYPMDFQLGNEPNNFKHIFNITLSGKQLAKDLDTLKSLLKSFPAYEQSKIISPEVTRPKHLEIPSLEYMKEFLSNAKSIDIISWHQYYLNGKTAVLEDFIDPKTFNIFHQEVNAIKGMVRKFSDLPIWISETGSAYGGGAPGLSDRFVASFLWLDKLGVSAKSGMSVIIRQSLLKGNYALIDDDLMPNPDFWVSLLFKKLAGTKVLNITYNNDNSSDFDRLRFYSHCSPWNNRSLEINEENGTNIVVYALNFSNRTEKVVVSGIGIRYPIESFVLTAENDNLTTKSVLLNGKKLIYNKDSVKNLWKRGERTKFPLVLPKYSIAFWILRSAGSNICG